MSPQRRRELVVGLPDGLHIRPLTILSQTANRFPCDITIIHGDVRVSAKSTPMDLLMLNAPKGSVVELVTAGEAADEAINKLVELFESNFGIEESESPRT